MTHTERTQPAPSSAVRADNQAYIAAIEYALPARMLHNAELAERHPHWQMDQVALRTGVLQRGWSAPDETSLDLGEKAAERLFASTGVSRGSIDALLFCTQTPDRIMPPNACMLQDRLGLSRTVAALDFTLACSGFVYGLYLGRALITSGSARNVLLITAETYSRLIHPDDRGPATLFGDAAAATLLSAGSSGIGHVRVGTDGADGDIFCVPAGGARLPRAEETSRVTADHQGNLRSAEHIHMDGPAVIDFVKREMPGCVAATLEEAGLSLEDIDLVVPHQASQVTLDLLYRMLRIPHEKRFSNLARVGNTVSASIPIALRDAETCGRLRAGMRVLVIGFGVGLSWGTAIIEWKSAPRSTGDDVGAVTATPHARTR